MKSLLTTALLAASQVDARITLFTACMDEYKEGLLGIKNLLPAYWKGNWYQIQLVGGDTGACATQKWTIVDAAASTYMVTKSSNGPWYWPFPGSVEKAITCKDGNGACGSTSSTGEFKVEENVVVTDLLSFALIY